MATCFAYSCGSHCNGHWAGCRNYGCVDYTAIPKTHTVDDSGSGGCVHQVTTICTTVSSWGKWIEVAGVSNGSYYSSRVTSATRVYGEVAGGQADEGELHLTTHVSDLRLAINEERARRIEAGISVAGATPVVWSTTDDIDASDINEMVTAVNQISANWITDVNPLPDQTSIDYHIDRIRFKIESLRQTCISNKVCSPNTTCSCYCHCNCHYSDARLKRNIRSL